MSQVSPLFLPRRRTLDGAPVTLLVVGFAFLFMDIILVMLGPQLAPVGQAARPYLPWGSPGHLLGTGIRGGDLLTYLLAASQSVLAQALLAGAMAVILGSLLAAAGRVRGAGPAFRVGADLFSAIGVFWLLPFLPGSQSMPSLALFIGFLLAPRLAEGLREKEGLVLVDLLPPFFSQWAQATLILLALPWLEGVWGRVSIMSPGLLFKEWARGGPAWLGWESLVISFLLMAGPVLMASALRHIEAP